MVTALPLAILPTGTVRFGVSRITRTKPWCRSRGRPRLAPARSVALRCATLRAEGLRLVTNVVTENMHAIDCAWIEARRRLGGVAEWSKAAVLKTAVGASLPGVRISPPPPVVSRCFKASPPVPEAPTAWTRGAWRCPSGPDHRRLFDTAGNAADARRTVRRRGSRARPFKLLHRFQSDTAGSQGHGATPFAA